MITSSFPYIVYAIINKINGKKYIGQTTQGLAKRQAEYKKKYANNHARSRILQAMVKYGFDSFVFEEIDGADSYEELNAMERYWIAFYDSTNPEQGYNILPGGRGSPRSIEARKNMSQSMKALYATGHVPHNVGKSPSLATRKRISEAGRRSIASKGYGKRSRKEIKCIETGEIFPSMSAAARAKGINPASLTQCMRNKKATCCGCHWQLTDNETSKTYTESPRMLALKVENAKRGKTRSNSPRCSVRCTETGQVFESMSVAAKHYGIDKRNIYSAIERKIKAGGVHWERLTPKHKHNTLGKRRKPVQAIDTGTIYPSLSDAAKAVNIDKATIWCAIRDGTRAAGLRWNYVSP